MNNYSLLPKRPQQFHDESVSGYLFRLFKANHFVPNSSFLRDVDLTYSQLVNNEIPERVLMKIAPWIHFEENHSMNNNYRFQGTTNQNWYGRIFQKNKIKYCPMCIHEKYYHRIGWCIFPLKICPKHFVILQEVCPSCHQIIDIQEFIEQRCKHCLNPFANSKYEYVKNDILKKSQARLERVLLHNEKSEIFGLNAIEYIELAFASFIFLDGNTDITGFTTENLTVFYNRKNEIKSSLNYAIAFSNVDWMYVEFPKHFIQVLDKFLLSYKGMKRYSAFNNFAKVVNKDCYPELREVFHSYCVQKLESGVIRRDFGVFRNEPELLKNRKVIRREEVKVRKGVTYGKLLRLSSSNIVSMEHRKNNEYYVDKQALENYLEEEKKWISKKEASLILGIHASSIESLIKRGVLQVSTKYSGNFKQVNFEQVKSLMERCKGNWLEIIPFNYINFQDALIKYSVNNLTIISIIQYTLTGKLRPVRTCADTTLADLYYDLDELNLCLLDLRVGYQKERGYYFTDLLKVLRIGEKRLRSLLESHKIQPDIIVYLKDGRTRSLYKDSTIFKIKEILDPSKFNEAKVYKD